MRGIKRRRGTATARADAAKRLVVSLRPARDEKLIEIIDRVLDRGVIVDASVKVSIAGISLLGIVTFVEMVTIERGPA